MGIKTTLQLINLEFKNDKLVTITKTPENGDKHETTGTVRQISVDVNLKKCFGLLGLYIGVINAHLPEIFINLARTFIGG